MTDVLCFGDSNTWGYNPKDGSRFPWGVRWTSVLQEQLKDIVVGQPETFQNQLKPILSNERLFFTDLYKDGVGEKIETMFRKMLAGPGAVKAVVHEYMTK